MFTEINHFGIVVRDLDASLAFYQGLFGARVVFDRPVPSAQTRVMYLQIGHGLIELLAREHPADDEVFGVTHIGFITDDLDGDYRMLTDAGYAGEVQPRAAGSGVGRMAFVRDPNGAQVELIQREDVRAAVEEHPVVAGFAHYAIRSRDLAGGTRFYADGLNMAVLPGEASDVTLTYGQETLVLLDASAEAGESVYAGIAVRVHDVSDALAAFGALGVPAHLRRHGDVAAVIRDPDGVEILLV